MAKAIKPVVLDAEEIPLEEQIENQLVKQNVTEAVIAGLKEKFGGLALKDLNDKEGYLEIKEARKEVRQWGILAEKICKVGREDAIKIQKLWLSKEKEVLGKIAEVQDPLDAELKKYEDEQERIEQEKIRKQEEANIQRQSTLAKYGAIYQDGHFVLNHISYEAILIKDADQDIWENTILPKYLAEYEKNEAERVAQEKKREEEMLALRKQQEEMEEQRRELERQQNEFRQQQESLRLQQEAADRERRLAEEDAARRKREEETALISRRVTQLKGVTWNGVTPSYTYNHEIIIKQQEVLDMSEEDFGLFRDKHNNRVDEELKAAEEKRQEEIRERERLAAEAAAKAERERIEREQQEAKQLGEAEAKRQAEEALKASDKTKWESFLNSVEGLIIAELNMKSPSYKNKIADAKKLLEKIKNL